MTPNPTAPALPLSVAFREGTAAEHAAAERSPFLTELLAGRINRRGYIDYLLRLRLIYQALEQALHAHRVDPVVAAVHDPALERLTGIDADLQYWAPDEPHTVTSPAALVYRDRIAGAGWAGALVAHHYTRYLGDLSGGRVIGTLLERSFGPGGLTFYEFPMRPKPYKDAYRARLDGLGFDRAETESAVDEVRIAFGLNQALFDELTANLAAYQR